ncbi:MULTISPECIES: hypothetical protein [Cyanophyceae]|uniref:PD-(D/E)XK endonuclease-like domain-containing protein n=2 Tax=Cyanophyceae TaxID=3028117 RepID=A0A4Q7E6H0_9CYAN|nr:MULTISPECIES: hypothetical protein [Cyanophyceae]MCM1983701.1 PD-(D/E)XK nuclease family protein [Lyngbya confervoides BDU141951]RZM77803.1 hypothetical protein DYY88_14605 [Leptolyngbya sp. LK]
MVAQKRKLGVYAPTERNGRSNIYQLQLVVGNGPQQLSYQRWQDGNPAYYFGRGSSDDRAFSFSAIKSQVTPILDPDAEQALKNWEKRVGKDEADRIRNESIAAGKMGHNMLERWNRGQTPGPFPMNMGGYVKALKDGIFPYLRRSTPPLSVIDQERNEVTLSEVFVADFEEQFIGRFDLVTEIAASPFDGARVLLELKGSRNEKSLEHKLPHIVQATAYLTTYNKIAAAFPEQIAPLDGIAMAYMYSSGIGEMMPILGEELQEYIEEWQGWLTCFQSLRGAKDAA